MRFLGYIWLGASLFCITMGGAQAQAQGGAIPEAGVSAAPTTILEDVVAFCDAATSVQANRETQICSRALQEVDLGPLPCLQEGAVGAPECQQIIDCAFTAGCLEGLRTLIDGACPRFECSDPWPWVNLLDPQLMAADDALSATGEDVQGVQHVSLAGACPTTPGTGIDSQQNLLHPEYYVDVAPCQPESVYRGVSDPESLQDSAISRIDEEHLNDAAYGLLHNTQRHRGSGPHSPYEIYRWYTDPRGSVGESRLPLGSLPTRWGTADWGYRHIVKEHGYTNDTNLALTYVFEDGRCKEKESVANSYQCDIVLTPSYHGARRACSWRIVLNRNRTGFDGERKGFITAYPRACT